MAGSDVSGTGGVAGCFVAIVKGTITNSGSYTLTAGTSGNGVGDQAGAIANGIEATNLPRICDVYLRARDAGAIANGIEATNGATAVAGQSIVMPML